jgi:succinate dehydrogenase / fumarate reductase, cytochrome b subunit
MSFQTPDATRQRPLSPHLQIYRWPVTMATSIIHRVTGLALAAGTLAACWWLMALASGDDAYATFSLVARSIGGLIVVFGIIWALAFHLLNGIRHLAWDLGHGFAVPAANRSGVLVALLSLVCAMGAFAYVYVAKGL